MSRPGDRPRVRAWAGPAGAGAGFAWGPGRGGLLRRGHTPPGGGIGRGPALRARAGRRRPPARPRRSLRGARPAALLRRRGAPRGPSRAGRRSPRARARHDARRVACARTPRRGGGGVGPLATLGGGRAGAVATVARVEWVGR